MAYNRMKFGYYNKSDIRPKLQDGTLSAYNVVYTKDTNETIFIAPDKSLVEIKSRVLSFADKQTAEMMLNAQPSTYPGQMVAVAVDGSYHAFVVSQNSDGSFYIEDASTRSYDELTDIPVINLTGTLAMPVILNSLNGIYRVQGVYKLTSADNVYMASTPIMVWVDSKSIRYSADGELKKYDKELATEETYVTDGDIVRSLAKQADINEILGK